MRGASGGSFPALTLVLLATLAFGWYMLLSDEFAQFGKQVTGGAAFVANLVFWASGLLRHGRGDQAAAAPVVAGHRGAVLHFLAAAAGVAWRKRWPIVRVILAMAVVSFLVNVLTVHSVPRTARSIRRLRASGS
jgi:hypothetical protein